MNLLLFNHINGMFGDGLKLPRAMVGLPDVTMKKWETWQMLFYNVLWLCFISWRFTKRHCNPMTKHGHALGIWWSYVNHGHKGGYICFFFFIVPVFHACIWGVGIFAVNWEYIRNMVTHTYIYMFVYIYNIHIGTGKMIETTKTHVHIVRYRPETISTSCCDRNAPLPRQGVLGVDVGCQWESSQGCATKIVSAWLRTIAT